MIISIGLFLGYVIFNIYTLCFAKKNLFLCVETNKKSIMDLLSAKILTAAAGTAAGYILASGDKKQQTPTPTPKPGTINTETIEESLVDDPYTSGRVITSSTQPSVNKPLYFGDKNKPYDPFYDYTGTNFYNQESINIAGISDPIRILRVRIIPEFVCLSKKYLTGTSVYNDDNLETDKHYVKINGDAVTAKMRIEVFNPSIYDVPLTKAQVEDIKINGVKMHVLKPTNKTDVGFATLSYYDANRGITNYIPGNWNLILQAQRNKFWRFLGIYPNIDITPANIPAMGSFCCDIDLPDMYDISAIEGITTEKGGYYKMPAFVAPTVGNQGGSLEVKFAFESGVKTGTVTAALYRGKKPAATKWVENYTPQYIGDLYPNLFNIKSADIAEQWQQAISLYNNTWAKCFEVDNAAMDYIDAVKAVEIKDKILELLTQEQKKSDNYINLTIKHFSNAYAMAYALTYNNIYDNYTPQAPTYDAKYELAYVYYKWYRGALEIPVAKANYIEAWNKDIANPVLLESMRYYANVAAGTTTTTTTTQTEQLDEQVPTTTTPAPNAMSRGGSNVTMKDYYTVIDESGNELGYDIMPGGTEASGTSSRQASGGTTTPTTTTGTSSRNTAGSGSGVSYRQTTTNADRTTRASGGGRR